MRKKGISLIVLVITIVVISILSVVIVVSVDNNIDNASIAGFMNDLKTVEDSFSATIIDSGSSGISTYSKAQVLELVDENSTEFENELVLNNDASETVFYIVNLNNIGILKSSRGNKKNADESDIYVVTKNSRHAYYLKGFKVNNVFYFSISNKYQEI